VVSAAFQEWADLGLIAAVIIINVAIGLIQEGKAEQAAQAIRKMLSPTAVVFRDGARAAIPAIMVGGTVRRRTN
jgi:magnesium-transporting ATPase (P-type)